MSTPASKMRMDEAARGAATPAFTLVESVVAGSAILFAIAVMAPSVRATRERGHVAACLANLRAIGQASLIYAGEDPNEIFIPVPNTDVLSDASGDFEWGGKSGIGQSADPNNPALSFFGTGAYRGPAHRPLNPYLYPGGFVDYNPPDGIPDPGPDYVNWLSDANLDVGIYRCPADSGYAGGGFLYTAGRRPQDNEPALRDEGLTAYDHYGTSYAANVFWISGGLLGARLRSQSVYLTPLSRVPSPSHTLAYQEVPSRFVWLWGDWSSAGPCDYSDRVNGNFNIVPGWHGPDFHFNVTFADGHAAMMKMQGCVRPAPNLGLMNYPPRQCDPSLDPYDCNRCVTFRGPEWNMDTLPTRPVLTPYFSDKSSAQSTDTQFLP